MTGTAETEASEFVSTYGLHVVPIPTHKPIARVDQGDLIYKTEDAKFQACIDDIIERNAAGQPVLVGTVSVEKSEKLSRMMEKQGVAHEVLNAKQHHREADIVTQAGRLGAVTVATNMAGRGVDILLGGNPEGLADRDTRLRVSTPTPPKVGPASRRSSPNTRQPPISNATRCSISVVVRARHGASRESPYRQSAARLVPARQGDPGESRFYLSLEDELMRLFATGAMDWVMGRALPDDVPLEAKMVTRAIERAQNTVEGRNAETRKNVLKYDEVMNEQRKVIYRRRGQILDGADLRDEALGTSTTPWCCGCHLLRERHCREWDLEALLTEAKTLWPSQIELAAFEAASSTQELHDMLYDEALALYETRERELGEPVLRQVERQVMLRIIDQRWRQHLREMDLLREGIHLRAMGQKDPATEWQREGFEMFGMMMTGIANDFVKYVMHVQVSGDWPRSPGSRRLRT